MTKERANAHHVADGLFLQESQSIAGQASSIGPVDSQLRESPAGGLMSSAQLRSTISAAATSSTRSSRRRNRASCVRQPTRILVINRKTRCPGASPFRRRCCASGEMIQCTRHSSPSPPFPRGRRFPRGSMPRQWGAEALLVLPSPILAWTSNRWWTWPRSVGCPRCTMEGVREAGGLMAYGPTEWNSLAAPRLRDKIPKGAKPATCR